MQKELDACAAAQTAHGGRSQDEDLCVAHPAGQLAAVAFGQGSRALAAFGALGPVGQAYEALARALVAGGATHHVVVQHLRLFGEVGLHLRGHGFHALAGGARRHAHLQLKAALVFVGQERGGQGHVHPGRAAHQQQEDGHAA